MAKILDGKALADKKLLRLKNELSGVPTLAILAMSDDPASEVYVRNKVKACKEVGIACKVAYMPCGMVEAGIKQLNEWAKDNAVDGIIVQLPCDIWRPAGYIPDEKDVDGFKPGSAFTPCTPAGIMELLHETGIVTQGLHAVIVGRSEIVGKPMARLLTDADCTVTLCHSKTQNLAHYTRQADILIVAAGKPHLITADMVKTGAIVIDVGINRVDGQLVGDVDYNNVRNIASWITPVPGGVGPMTVASLMENVCTAWRWRKFDHA